MGSVIPLSWDRTFLLYPVIVFMLGLSSLLGGIPLKQNIFYSYNTDKGYFVET